MPISSRLIATTALLLAMPCLAACTNTGDSVLFDRIDRQEEIRIGEENFYPVQQVRGGVYTLDPELSSYVESIGQRLAREADVDLPWEFVIINNSLPNAWSLPGGKIAINRGLLLALNDEAELAAVLSHEIAHAANSHAARAMERGLLIEATMRALGLGGEAGHSAVDSGVIGIKIIAARFSQSAEFEADADGMRYMAEAGFDLGGAIDLQNVMLRENGNASSDWKAGLTGSHPASTERLTANRRIRAAFLERYPAVTDDGRERYQKMTRRIRATEDAYIKYNVAIWELTRGNLDEAHRQIHGALSIEKREAKFHALYAEYLERIGDTDAALEEYDVAIRLEPAYYALHQGKGLLLMRLGDLDRARASLAIANAQLQNAETHEGLGDIAVAQGRVNDAIGHYTLAARSSSVAGNRAREKLQELERSEKARQAGDDDTADSRRQSPN